MSVSPDGGKTPHNSSSQTEVVTERSASPSTVTLTWRPTRSHTKKALFRIDTDDGVATLQHIREIVTQQRGESTHDLITDPELADIPPQLLAILKDEGFTPATEVER